MKIIQTFVAEPLYSSPYNKASNFDFGFGGFANRFDYYSTWLNSFQSISKFYDKITLFCDELGREILIEKLGLNYHDTKILEMPYFAKYSDSIWAASKIKVYSLQNEPFLHIDGDLLLNRPIPEKLFDSEIIVEFPHLEIENAFFDLIKKVNQILGINKVLKTQLPDLNIENLRNPIMYNFGIFGGNAFDEIRNISKIALESAEFLWNSGSMPSSNLINPLIEQLIISQYLLQKQLRINFLTEVQLDRERFFKEFLEKGFSMRHTHLLSYNKVHYAQYMNSKLLQEDKEKYYLLIDLIRKGEI